MIITPQLEYEPVGQLRLLAQAEQVGLETYYVTVWSPDLINSVEVFRVQAAADYRAVQEAMAQYQRRHVGAARSRVVADAAAG
jgi:hypothetical protein